MHPGIRRARPHPSAPLASTLPGPVRLLALITGFPASKSKHLKLPTERACEALRESGGHGRACVTAVNAGVQGERERGREECAGFDVSVIYEDFLFIFFLLSASSCMARQQRGEEPTEITRVPLRGVSRPLPDAS